MDLESTTNLLVHKDEVLAGAHIGIHSLGKRALIRSRQGGRRRAIGNYQPLSGLAGSRERSTVD